LIEELEMTRTTNARLAGFMFLFYIASGIAGMMLFNPTRGIDGTAAKLAAIAQHAALVRGAAVFALIAMMNAFILAVALYALTRDYDRDIALLALVCRVAEGVMAAVGAVAKRALLAAAIAAPTSPAAAALGDVLLKNQGLTTLIGATAFAIGSTLYCYLFLRARSIPLWMAWLGVLASALLVIALPIELAGGPATGYVWAPMAVFEVVFALWLIARAGTVRPAE
jgi:hypothetical protein